MKSPVSKLSPRHCRLCGHGFRPKRKNQRHCCASHRVRDAVRRFWAKNKRDYHVRLVVGRMGRCENCKKPQIFRSKTAKFCNEECERLHAKATRSD